MQNKDNKKHGLKNILIWGILGLFIISGMLQGNLFNLHNPVIAHVGKQKIKVSDIRKYMNLIKLPEGLDRESLQAKNYLFSKALDLMIQRALITQECKRLGFVVSDEVVTNSIKKKVQFHENGVFSRDKFLKELGKLRLSEMEYKSIEKEDLLHSQWIFMLESAYCIPDFVANSIANAAVQRRNGRYIAIENSKIKVPKLNTAQITKFYKDNIELFKKKEEKIFSVIEIPNSKNLENIEYLLSKQKFDDVAKKFGFTIYTSDNLPDIKEKEAISKLAKRLNDLEIGKNDNRVYVIGDKYYAFKLVKIIPMYTPSLEEIRSQVESEYAKQYRSQHVNINGKEWIKLINLKLGETYLGVPEIVVNAIFMNAPNKIFKYEQNDITYYVITDKILNGVATPAAKIAAREYLSSRILNDVIFAAMKSLKRYKITVLI